MEDVLWAIFSALFIIMFLLWRIGDKLSDIGGKRSERNSNISLDKIEKWLEVLTFLNGGEARKLKSKKDLEEKGFSDL